MEASRGRVNKKVPAKQGMETKNIRDWKGGDSKQGTNKVIRRILPCEDEGCAATGRRRGWLSEAEQPQKEEIG